MSCSIRIFMLVCEWNSIFLLHILGDTPERANFRLDLNGCKTTEVSEVFLLNLLCIVCKRGYVFLFFANFYWFTWKLQRIAAKIFRPFLCKIHLKYNKKQCGEKKTFQNNKRKFKENDKNTIDHTPGGFEKDLTPPGVWWKKHFEATRRRLG